MIEDDQPGPAAELPAHIADTVTGMAKVHSEHQNDASRLDLIFAKIAGWLGHPGFTLVLSGFVIAWIGVNLAFRAAGRLPPDPPPFPLLSGLVALAALYMTGIILTTQRREDIRCDHRQFPGPQMRQIDRRVEIGIRGNTPKLPGMVVIGRDGGAEGGASRFRVVDEDEILRG